MKPKVLVGAPVSDNYEYCFNEFCKGIEILDYPAYDVLLVDNSRDDKFYEKIKELKLNITRIGYCKEARDRMVNSRNLLRQYILDNDYDYLLSLDVDIVLNRDTLTRLLSHQKEVITAVYFRELSGSKGQRKIVPLILVKKKDEPDKLVLLRDIWKPRLAKINMCGLGCILMHRDVLEKIKFRYDDGFDDEAFCMDLARNNIDLYVDTSIKCKHLILKRPWDWDNFNIKK